jgi:hypothetical protein
LLICNSRERLTPTDFQLVHYHLHHLVSLVYFIKFIHNFSRTITFLNLVLDSKTTYKYFWVKVIRGNKNIHLGFDILTFENYTWSVTLQELASQKKDGTYTALRSGDEGRWHHPPATNRTHRRLTTHLGKATSQHPRTWPVVGRLRLLIQGCRPNDRTMSNRQAEQNEIHHRSGPHGKHTGERGHGAIPLEHTSPASWLLSLHFSAPRPWQNPHHADPTHRARLDESFYNLKSE